MATPTRSFEVVSLEDIEPGPGVRANRAVGDWHVVGEHDAIAYLEQAIEDDQRISENIRTDGDLDSLSEDPRFQALTG
jgi:hypothetical protein